MYSDKRLDGVQAVQTLSRLNRKIVGKDEPFVSAFRDKLAGYVRMYSFLSQTLPYADRDLEMLYSYVRFLLPHLRLDRENTAVQLRAVLALMPPLIFNLQFV
jgi:hypothetical protein